MNKPDESCDRAVNHVMIGAAIAGCIFARSTVNHVAGEDSELSDPLTELTQNASEMPKQF